MHIAKCESKHWILIDGCGHFPGLHFGIIMTVRLRVVGLFFDDSAIPIAAGATIKDALESAVLRSEGNFSFSSDRRFDPRTNSVVETLKGFRNSLPGPLMPTLGGRSRAPGTYEIEEEVSVINGVTLVRAWQYYVIRSGSPVSNATDGTGAFDASPAVPVPPATAGFTPFTTFNVNDGDEIIWRNVSIARSPR